MIDIYRIKFKMFVRLRLKCNVIRNKWWKLDFIIIIIIILRTYIFTVVESYIQWPTFHFEASGPRGINVRYPHYESLLLSTSFSHLVIVISFGMCKKGFHICDMELRYWIKILNLWNSFANFLNSSICYG